MKRKFVINITMLIVCIALAPKIQAQQVQQTVQQNTATPAALKAPENYTYKIFQAPNKMYGYDIFSAGRIIFHQGASPAAANEFIAATSTQEQAKKAALLSVEKLNKNQPAALSQQELKKIITEKKP